MKHNLKSKPRLFTVGINNEITIKDYGSVSLCKDEMVTLKTKCGRNFDIVNKSWGFYATPSYNKRLRDEGFLTAHVENSKGSRYIMLVVRDLLDEFLEYCQKDNQTVIGWLEGLDNQECLCQAPLSEKKIEYFAPPPGETIFSQNDGNYYRFFYKCDRCGHFTANGGVEAEDFYKGDYASFTYGAKLNATFEKIIKLPSENSDNIGRLNCIEEFTKYHWPSKMNKVVLDVGAGLGVFPWILTQNKWTCVAVEPDPQAAEHIRRKVGIETINSSFYDYKAITPKYSLITFNKVLEHVKDPISFLSHARDHLMDDGLVYIEVPDASMAEKNNGINSEEFFIEHLHVFSMQSLTCLIERAGFVALRITRLREPSGKYTLRAFCHVDMHGINSYPK